MVSIADIEAAQKRISSIVKRDTYIRITFTESLARSSNLL